MAITLLDLTAILRTIGRASVFYGAKWTGTPDLIDGLTHMGDTEGDVVVETNESFSTLEIPELTGESQHEAYSQGPNPVVTIPMYLADPATRAIASPTGSASGGHQRRQAVTEYTLLLVPEQMFIEAGTQAAIDYTTVGGWTVGGDAATAAQLAMMDQALWIWRGYFTRPPITYSHTDAGKNVDSFEFQAMFVDISTSYIPDGQRIYTLGDPADVSIDINPSG